VERLVPTFDDMATTRANTAGAAAAAVEELRTALAGVGVVLPSLSYDIASPDLHLVELGRVSSDVALRLAEALRRGAPW
jgi:hypothetical protein